MPFAHCDEPLFALNPASSWKIAFVPPPRSSLPFRPKRLPAQMPVAICTFEWPPEVAPVPDELFCQAMALSTIPYRVTLL